MKARRLVALGLGLALTLAILIHYGFDDVLSAFAAGGWGVVCVAGFHVLPLGLGTLGWRSLFPERTVDARAAFKIHWVGESVNTLLPVAQIGGEFVRARLVCQAGLERHLAGATVVVDLTARLLTQILFAGVGILLLLRRGGADDVTVHLAVGLGVFAALISGFLVAQRRGLFASAAKPTSLLGKHVEGFVGGATDLDRSIRALYSRTTRVIACHLWRTVSWFSLAGEIWIGLYFLGFEVGLEEAIIIQSLTSLIRTAGFVVPGALGIQEGGFVLTCGLVGLSPEVALALALIRRARELLLGAPGLLVWFAIERQPAEKSRAGPPAPPP